MNMEDVEQKILEELRKNFENPKIIKITLTGKRHGNTTIGFVAWKKQDDEYVTHHVCETEGKVFLAYGHYGLPNEQVAINSLKTRTN